MSTVLEPGRTTVVEVAAGARLVVELAAGPQPVSFASFAAEDHDERTSMYTTQSVNRTWQLRSGHVVMGTDSRELWTVVEDAGGAIYCGGGYCAPLLDPATRPDPDPADEGRCDAVLARDLAPRGLGPRQLGPDAHLNLFQLPSYEPGGGWRVHASTDATPRRVVLRAWFDQLVVVLACDHGPRVGDVQLWTLAEASPS